MTDVVKFTSSEQTTREGIPLELCLLLSVDDATGKITNGYFDTNEKEEMFTDPSPYKTNKILTIYFLSSQKEPSTMTLPSSSTTSGIYYKRYNPQPYGQENR